ncbi:uncharacterized protein SPPG_00750 [Spizellomyces punctatus DAOM BR117]|uniref:Uncharacterized protein n=1 Tax=Spizellomyces punctatus (strain DAOM BR117) TaxID=645134 RepID=A0A0L0HW12_SPIPD|nr:uncharacterized protein SPPG_00750 [Spizellomyces punctatus DAOM BR117]KND05075.1 hypothetical protein SPPG_00750 [Spizellomyces punctatus DAOM BR117]|eukprot:XP_016613114.1 hypothetical protein SPPG_00750 [Spizellomyces punctatus DAOM BR117]
MQVLRRAEPRDVPGIVRLVKRESNGGKDDLEKTLKRRFGEDFDIAELIDTCPFSIVGTDAEDTQIYGFLALCNGPPAFMDKSGQFKGDSEAAETARGDWPKWLRRWYDSPDVQVHNTKFLAFFVADPDHSLPFLDEALTTAFTLLPNLSYISYLLPEQLVLFPPLSSARYLPSTSEEAKHKKSSRRRLVRGRGKKGPAKYFVEAPSLTNSATFALWICARKDVLPILKVRNARVEDADDLVPMFRKQKIIKEKDADFYIANLLESKTGHTRTLVAEADGEVVGFMSFDRNIQQQALVDTFHLEAFDYLLKEVPERKKSKATTPASNKPGSASLSLGPASRPLSGVTSGLESPAMTRPGTQEQEGYINSLGTAPITPRSDSFVRPMSPFLPSSPTKPSSPPSPSKPQTPITQTPNAFCISLFSMDDAYAKQSIEFVKTAFTHLFPDLDYCVVTVPTTAPEMPLLKDFASVPAKAGMTSLHCLYLINRFGITEPVSVQRAAAEDRIEVDAFLEDVSSKENILSVFDTSIQPGTPTIAPKHHSFTIRYSEQLIGLVILESLHDVKPYTDQFAIHDFIHPRFLRADAPIVLRHFLVNPLFEHQARWVFEELFRITGSKCFIYPVLGSSDSATKKIAVRELAPVRRRREIQFPGNLRDGKPVPPPFRCSLQLITTALLHEPKIMVNTRIVVIGGSDTGIAFIENLVYNPHLWFTNLTLVSMDGAPIPDEKDGDVFVSHRCYSPTELDQLGLPHYVKIIRGSTDEIDRLMKRVHLTNGSFVNYDYLILTPGLQFSVATLNEELADTTGVYALNRENALEVNDAIDHALMDSSASKIVVYGRHIQAYSGVQLLLSKGVSPSRIVLVVPPLRVPASCFNNGTVDEKIHAVLDNLGVTVYRGWSLLKWEEERDALSAVHLKSKSDDMQTLICDTSLFLYADERSVVPDTFKSINDSCLVFDGRLVIDKYYRTQDPFVYAAGSITKYSSRYQTKWAHEYSDSREVGRKLADLLLPLFDPTCLPNILVENDEILQFEDAKKTLTLLPGDLFYFHFDCPRLPSHTLEYRKQQGAYGRDLVLDTLDVASCKGSYFRIHVDPMGYIRSLTYLGQQTIPIDNIVTLYGMHEKYFKRLVARFDEGIITDFASYLNEPWALPLYYDQFPECLREIRQELLNLRYKEGDEIGEVVETLAEHAEARTDVPDEERKNLYKAFDNAPGRKSFDDRIFKYLLETQIYNSYP